MTKVSVFGQQPTETKELKKIEFVKCIASTGKYTIAADPSIWDNVQLFIKNYRGGGFDIILAWEDNRPQEKVIYLGHWNDGIV